MRLLFVISILALPLLLSCGGGSGANITIDIILSDGGAADEVSPDGEVSQIEIETAGDSIKDTPDHIEAEEMEQDGAGEEESPSVCVKDEECEGEFPVVGECEKPVCDGAKCKLALKEDFETCDDKEQCTTGDFCYQGLCFGGENICKCDDDEYCAKFDDLNKCNGSMKCLGGFCAIDPETVVSCDVSNDDDCKKMVCVEATGECAVKFAEDGTPCDDFNPCTLNNRCYQGICVSDESLDCNDFNDCTGDWCDPLSGCVNEPLNEPCEDGNLCTTGDMCAGGECASGDIKDCGDSNPCTDEYCDPVQGCLYSFNNSPCSDGDLCTVNDQCEMGECLSGKALVCDDKNPCTDDSCDPGKGCLFVNNDANKCDDSNICTSNDFCAGGKCEGTGNICNCDTNADCAKYENGDLCDGTYHCLDHKCVIDPATIKVCDSSGDTDCKKVVCEKTTGECKYKNEEDGKQCDDGSLCTINDKCSGGECTGETIICGDGNICTDDYCDPLFGCIFKYNAIPCSDNNACTYGDTCTYGVCVGKKLNCDDSNPCTDDYCDNSSGCKYAFNTKYCDDGSKCTIGDKCLDGQCIGTSSLNCDDNNPCTTDSCDPSAGCQYYFNSLPCEDGYKCTQGEKCANGECAGGTLVNCEDGNICTDNSCVEPIGCVASFNSKNCDDGDKCTEEDKCASGVCAGTKPKDCSDGNLCTDDLCNPATGCYYSFNTKECNDLDPCTTSDYCSNGECKGSGELPCDDGNLCTDDKCEPFTGCVYKFNTDKCDDNDKCTKNDKCLFGKCVGTAVSCDDKLPCTVDTCSSTSGCIFYNTCVQPNPDCTAEGCGCGKVYCHPELSDKCLNGKCYCGNDEACVSPKKCVNGECVP